MDVRSPRSPGRGLPALVALLLLAACAENDLQSADAPSPGETVEQERPPPRDPQPPFFSPLGGPAGSQVELWMDGLPAEAPMMIGFGTVRQHQIIDRATVDDEGSLRVTVEIPSGAEANASHYFFVADPVTQQPLSVSDAFLVTAPDGSVRVSGQATDEGERCQAVRGNEEELYTLHGDVPPLETGDRVVVRGRLAEDAPCGQGTTIEVDEVRIEP